MKPLICANCCFQTQAVSYTPEQGIVAKYRGSFIAWVPHATTVPHSMDPQIQAASFMRVRRPVKGSSTRICKDRKTRSSL